MPSRITRDEVEDAIWRSGIRSKAVTLNLLRVIDLYAHEVHRRISAPGLEGSSLDDLLPGQWDKEAEVTRCRSCEQVKKWHPHFHADKSSPSGRRSICKVCVSQLADVPAADGWVCPLPPKGCGHRKKRSDFPEEKLDNPRKPILCNACQGKNA